jgi:hypothetical protein
VFDRCLRWRALRPGMHIGVLHKILDMKIDEVGVREGPWTGLDAFCRRSSHFGRISIRFGTE